MGKCGSRDSRPSDVLPLLTKCLRRVAAPVRKCNATEKAQTGWFFKVAQTLKNHPVCAFKGSVSFS